MSHVEIRIHEKSNPERAFPEYKNGVNGDCLGFAILEGGTVSGKTSCGIITKGADGIPVVVQFTGDMFLNMAAALKGARERFGDPWNGV